MDRARPLYADDLDLCLAEAERRLARGVADRRSPFHTPVLATVAAEGGPAARTVVLRGFDAAARSVRVHTDTRSAKAAEIARNPMVALHFYDAGAQIQLRLAGRAALHTDDAVAEAAWRASREGSRFCYAVEPAPGTRIGAPLPAPADAASGRAHFAALLVAYSVLEFLWLAAEGHRRARFAWTAGGLDASWLVP